VSEDLFRQAQDKLRNARRLYAGRKPEYPYLLTGITKCADCGLSMHGSTRNIWGQYMPCYTCAQPGPTRTGCRPIKYVRAEHLEAVVWGLVKKWVSDPEALAEEIVKSIPHTGDIEEEMFRLKKELAALEKGYSNLIAAMAQGVLDLTPEVKNSLATNKEKKQAIEKRLRELNKLVSSNIAETTIKKLIGLAQTVLKNIDRLSSEDKRAIIRTLIDEIEVAGRGKEVAVTITSSLSQYQVQLKGKPSKITVL
jgi:site-specific DNA recombinase